MDKSKSGEFTTKVDDVFSTLKQEMQINYLNIITNIYIGNRNMISYESLASERNSSVTSQL